MSASYPTKIMLAMKSGNKCALVECRKNLVSDGKEAKPAIIGEAAHIYGENAGTKTKKASARYKADMTDEERNHLDNLIYLCPTCHTKIDKQEEDYPADQLFKIKSNHENWVIAQLDEQMSEITFAELDVAAKAIATGQHSVGEGFTVIPPEEKIAKNELSNEVSGLIAMGLSRSNEVSGYLCKVAQLDPDFPERLSNGFKEKYVELKHNFSGDQLFMSLLNFAQSGQIETKHQAASLAILSHLFHICEVFEK